jgi:hypothetical protein
MAAKDPRTLGHNKSVELGGRRLMVQTEVLGKGELKIRTTVLESGVVRYSESNPCPGNDVEQVRPLVDAQHARNVERVQRGEV